jgi:hypothetical protein
MAVQYQQQHRLRCSLLIHVSYEDEATLSKAVWGCMTNFARCAAVCAGPSDIWQLRVLQSSSATDCGQLLLAGAI